MKTKYLKLAVSAALTLPLLGCFGTDEGTSSNETAAKSEIRVAMMVPPRTGLSPLSDDAFKLSRWSTAETLVNLTPEGDAEAMLATDWEQVDDLTWRFAIREG
ncbi:oligopeptide ABC transporter [Vibrio astriarenae]|nr:oligopeptide ABC transporter [Vibrio sp. C7]